MSFSRWKHLALGLLGLLTRAYTANAVQQNITIDDTNGDNTTLVYPTYGPSWHSSAACAAGNSIAFQVCRLGIDAAQAEQGTWTGIVNRGDDNFTISFDGTAIYVYQILPAQFLQGGGITVETVAQQFDVTFTLDTDKANAINKTFLLTGNNVTQYNVLAYSRTGLSTNERHTLNISTGNLGFVFDYALYTIGEEDSSSSALPSSTSSSASFSPTVTSAAAVPSKSSQSIVGPVVGAVAGGAFVVVCLAAAFCLRRRRRIRERSLSLAAPDARPGTPKSFEAGQMVRLPLEQGAIIPYLPLASEDTRNSASAAVDRSVLKQRVASAEKANADRASASSLPSGASSRQEALSRDTRSSSSYFLRESQSRGVSPTDLRSTSDAQRTRSASGPGAARVRERRIAELEAEVQRLQQGDRRTAALEAEVLRLHAEREQMHMLGLDDEQPPQYDDGA